MKKTVEEYLNQLQPHHRDFALTMLTASRSQRKVNSLQEAIDCLSRGEGSTAWCDSIINMLNDGEYFDAPQHTPEEFEGKAKDFIRKAAYEAHKPSEDVLEEALRITGGDRMADYGPPDQDFRRTAVMWEQLLTARIIDGKLDIRPQDVASCMIAIKLSRQTHQNKRDNWVDLAGYARCGNLCMELEQNND